VATVALVGYTNAGKSCLFNRLTGSELMVQDQLFATLDPTLRQISIDPMGTVIIADTVGFIRELPHELVTAFHATLEEVVFAQVLLHVIDVTDPQRQHHQEAVKQVLAELEADQIPQILVYNKSDLNDEWVPHIERDQHGVAVAVWVSAKTGAGIELLLQVLSERLAPTRFSEQISLNATQAKLRAQLYDMKAVKSEQIDADNGNWILDIELDATDYQRMAHHWCSVDQ